jgi:hypothetical protein
MGDDQPRPGISCDQATPSVCDHFSGSFLAMAMPFIACPRNPGHVFAGFGSATAAAAQSMVQVSVARDFAGRFMNAPFAHDQDKSTPV